MAKLLNYSVLVRLGEGWGRVLSTPLPGPLEAEQEISALGYSVVKGCKTIGILTGNRKN